MLRASLLFALFLAPCGPAPAGPAAPSPVAGPPGTTVTTSVDGGEPYVVDRVCMATLPSGGPTLVVHGCDCYERLVCTASVSGHKIVISAHTEGVAACDECNQLEGLCDLGRLPTKVRIAIEVAGKPIGELETDAAGSFAPGECFEASQPGPG